MEFRILIHALQERLKRPLPGRSAHLKMASMVRIQTLMNLVQSENAIQSSVLILLYPKENGVGVVLMRRPDYDGIHSGQISLPGGKYEEDDESLIYTALREAQEEIGVDPAQIQILGQLTELYIPPSNYIVTPIAGYSWSRPEFTADPKEVAAVIEISLSDLLNKSNLQRKKMKLGAGFSLKVPSYFIDGNIIWGATAMILSEFCTILEEIEAGI